MTLAYVYLVTAILSETTATAALSACDGFTKPLPTFLVVAGYGLSLLFLSLTLRSIPVGIAYAIWAGAGTACIGLIGAIFLRQPLDCPAIAGIALIVSGVMLINIFSRSLEY